MDTRSVRLPEIDWLKGFAILSVLCIHSRLFDGHLVFAHIINRAVGIFLVLFGVTSELWWQKLLVGRSRSVGLSVQWYRDRLVRLMVPVWAIGALWWLTVIYFGRAAALQLSAARLIATGLGYMPWLGMTWFVTLILQLVVLFPLIRELLRPRAAAFSLLLAATLCVASSLHLWDIIALGRRVFGMGLGVPEPGWEFHWMFAPRVLWHVLCGAYVARRWGGRPGGAVTWIAGMATLLGVPLVTLVRGSAEGAVAGGLRELALFQLLDVPLTVALLGVLRTVPLPSAVRTSLGWCGLASWGLYLAQVWVDEFLHMCGLPPTGHNEFIHAAHALALFCGAVSLVIAGGVLKDRSRAVLGQLRTRFRAGKRDVAVTRPADFALLARAIALAACAGMAFAIVTLALRPWYPAFDEALIWLRTCDVGGRYTPLLGPYSRFGWHHPGPALYFSLALPLRLLDTEPASLLIGALLVALTAAIALVLLVAKHAGPNAGVVLAVAIACLIAGLGDQLINPWNPYMLVVPFGLFLAALWSWSDGERAALPIAAAAGSFAAQAHVGMMPLLFALCGTAISTRFAWPAAAPSRPRGRAPLIATAIVLVLFWTLPLVAEVTERAGNLRRIAQFFFGPSKDEVVGLGHALGLSAAELLPWGSWIGRQKLGMMTDVLPVSAWHLAWPLLLIALAAVLSKRWQDEAGLRLAVLLLVCVGACVYSFAHVHGLVLGYLALWTRVIAMFCVAAPLIVIGRRLDRSGPPSRARTNALGAVAVSVVLAVFANGALKASPPDAFQSGILARFADQIRGAVPKHTLVRAVAIGTPFTVSPESLAVLLLRAGRRAGLQPPDVSVPGVHRCVKADAILPTIALASGPGIEILRAKAVGRVLAEFDPLAVVDRAEANRLRALLEAQLVRDKREDLIAPLRDAAQWLPWQPSPSVDQRVLARYLELAGGLDHLAFALFLFPPSTW